jgi:hypothetical protein
MLTPACEEGDEGHYIPFLRDCELGVQEITNRQMYIEIGGS